jgi:galactoside O-acetyltransferase
MAFLSTEQLRELGLQSFGDNVLISDKASIHGARNVRIGSNVRIDDFCVLSAGSGGITLGNNIHLGALTSLIGAGAILIGDFANFSSRVAVYSSNDDYSGSTMTNPTIPDRFKRVDHRPVIIGRHAIIGCGSVLLPGVILGEGVAIGAISLVTASCAPFTVYAGSPARAIKPRLRNLLELEAEYLRDLEKADEKQGLA